MSSASKPKTPHTKVDRPTTDGEGDEEVTVVPVPLLDDNYSYVLLHKASRTAALVDPADPYPVVKLMQEQYSDYQIHTILTTHKHCQWPSQPAGCGGVRWSSLLLSFDCTLHSPWLTLCCCADLISLSLSAAVRGPRRRQS